MRNFYALAYIGKHRSMLADNIARTYGRKTNRSWHTLAGMSFPTVNCTIFQILIQRMGNRLPIANAVPDGASTLWR